MKENRKLDQKDYLYLSALAAISVFFNFFKIIQEGFGNTFYAATVYSMTTGFWNFLYASYDPAGFLGAGKPPLGLWIQAIFALILGFKGWVIMLPQGISGVLSGIVLYIIARQSFGRITAMTASLVMLLSPVFIATCRNNTMDAVLLLVLLISALLFLKFISRKSILYFYASLILTGIGFNIKMLQAYMILPVIYFFFLKAYYRKDKWKIIHVIPATVIMIIISLSWSVYYDLSSGKKPFVTASPSNSMLELVTGHNGLARISGVDRGMITGKKDDHKDKSLHPMDKIPPSFAETGFPGITRLFRKELAAQASWFIGFILSGLVLVIAGYREMETNEKQALAFWCIWFFIMALYFSFTSGIFHRYYLIMITPAAGMLSGIIFEKLSTFCRRSRFHKLIVSIIFLVSVMSQCFIISYYHTWNYWIIYTIAGLSIVTIFLSLQIIGNKGLARMTLLTSMAVLFLAPAIWSYYPIRYGGNVMLPYSGNELENDVLSSRNIKGFEPMYLHLNTLANYLARENSRKKFLLATSNVNLYASTLIISTGKPVLVYGGFTGNDRIISVDEMKKMIENKEISFFLMHKPPEHHDVSNASMPPAPPPGRANEDIDKFILDNGIKIPDIEWKIPLSDIKRKIFHTPGNLELYKIDSVN
ncbi:MAG: glycosyltransferase family 39 protein [Candidatus Coatesbacteria bacterium]|nr:glycosyltransferase family 39 protein [Candidatus Coatesbacteria bacterium]